MKKSISFGFLLAVLVAIFFACQDHAVDPGTGPGGTTGPGSGTGTMGPGTSSGVSIEASLTVTALMSNTTSTNTTCSGSTGLANVVCLTNAFLSTLDATQKNTAQLTYSLANAQKWSNLPAGLSARYGVNLASLTATQLAAFRNLMVAVLALHTANEGYDEMLGNLVADNVLYYAGGGTTYGAGNFYVSILGTPSTSGLWEILFTGHHYTQPYTFNGPSGSGYTPAFRGVEPTSVVSNTATGQSYQSMEQERVAFAAMLTGLSSGEQTTAKLSSTFSDIVLGPGQDWKFPTTKAGLRVGDLSTDKQKLVQEAIKLYVNDLDATTAASVLAKYTSELANTYIAYSGSTSVTAQNDYIRIDGPSVWIEFSYQGGVIIRNTPHPHSVWRDRTTDYGGTK
ncbi:DUF3500 domain-containing protein [Spirosoma validum]|uniref:DUF3500 domain-containing protein n=1 Tax=Spirosoma validum TaxID=2771355 RepID=A0A927GCM7_9BACT|nr:DUF3500 domain-containing protein [Spirosoma validum]MBD2752917.1 DUF3500 domain-containing protein [Spirosoma validum]